MNIDKILDENIKRASIGRSLWISFIEKYQPEDKDFILLMPSANREYNYYSLLYIKQFIQYKKANKIYVLTFDECVKKSCYLFSDQLEIVDFSREDARNLMKFYSLYMFTDKLIIASLDEPEGRSGKQLIGKKDITIDEIFAIGIFGLRKFHKEKPPVYTGNDSDILSFIGSRCENEL